MYSYIYRYTHYMSYINQIGLGSPPYLHNQSKIAKFMAQSMALNEKDTRILSLMYAKGGVSQRYSAIPDYDLDLNLKERLLYPETENLEPFPNIEKRMEIYFDASLKLAVSAIENLKTKVAIEEITHLITVSCTGLSAPGLDIQLVEALNLNLEINRTSINFMGCYAAIHALKQADTICRADANAKVLVVCVELCTLHFQKENTEDNLLANLLFADGAAAVLISNDVNGLEINQFYSKLAFKGYNDMAWRVSSSGFLMTLTSYIPQIIETEIEAILESAIGGKEGEITHFAIHPGGKKIVESIQKALKLPNEKVEDSLEVLKNYGNMSSPTVLFVLERILNKSKSNEKIFSVAFGPGLTMESLILTKI
jgi:predicted naringenin-chalcone synthase